MEAARHRSARPPFEQGVRVVVLNSLNTWSSGFQVHDVDDGRVRLRRLSDGAVLPRRFSPDELRPD